MPDFLAWFQNYFFPCKFFTVFLVYSRNCFFKVTHDFQCVQLLAARLIVDQSLLKFYLFFFFPLEGRASNVSCSLCFEPHWQLIPCLLLKLLFTESTVICPRVSLYLQVFSCDLIQSYVCKLYQYASHLKWISDPDSIICTWLPLFSPLVHLKFISNWLKI